LGEGLPGEGGWWHARYHRCEGFIRKLGSSHDASETCAVLRCGLPLLCFSPAALPTLDIAEGALNKLIDTYKQLLPRLGGYLTHAGAHV
jgi:hypothetical protein